MKKKKKIQIELEKTKKVKKKKIQTIGPYNGYTLIIEKYHFDNF